MASTFLTRTPSSAGNRKTFTISAWVKRGTISSANSQIISTGVYSSSQLFQTFFESDDTLYISDYTSGGSKSFQLSTNRKLRDINCWYHILFAVDTTQGTASNRVKVYINGVQETSFSEATYPSQNFDCAFNLNQLHTIANRNGTNFEFGGSMSYLASVDGTAELPTIFGETDTTTGQWKIKTSITPSVAWGTNGFLILKNGNSLTDESTNSNNWSLGGGTLTNTLDCPDNVFATMNVLDKNSNVVLTNGNNSLSTTNNGNWVNASRATLGIGSRKVYWEMKITGSGNSNGYFFGICADTVNLNTTSGLQDTSAERAKGMLLFCDDGQYQLDNNSRQSMTTGAALNDVLACAVDRSSNNVKFYKNGAQVGSIDISSSPLATVSDIMPLTIGYYTALQLNHNFGNGVFGTTAVSSSGTSASTPGTFEHDVPSGYEPLSTKGLNA